MANGQQAGPASSGFFVKLRQSEQKAALMPAFLIINVPKPPKTNRTMKRTP
jgi:hypothetical protein